MKINRKIKINKKIYMYLPIMLAAILLFILEKDEIMRLKNLWDPITIRDWINSFGQFGIVIFILLQIIQVVIFAIPGEVVQLAGGYIYNAFWGTVLSIVGILLGSAITFGIGRKFGEDLLRKIIPSKHYNSVNSAINRPKNKLVLFILYVIPGIPKDILGYVAGITKLGFKPFIIISTLGRIPGVFISAYMGANIYNRKYSSLLVSAIILFVIFILLMVNKDKIIRYFTRD